jgi:asparagine N-glycosylation enzyme membrane subunit Stt3
MHIMAESPREERQAQLMKKDPLLSIPHLMAFATLWLLVQLVFLLTQNPEVLTGAQIDTDGYMRLVRVRLLLEHGAWFDGTIPRSNWPFGEVLHWTRPLDVLIILISLPFQPFMTSDAALAVAGALVSPLCHFAACVATAWLVRPLVSGRERFLAMPAMLLQPGPLGYGTAGRADHHALIFLLFLLALAAWIRVLTDQQRAKPAVLAGVLSGVGIWVSPETLLPLALLFLSGALVWLIDGDRILAANRRFCAGLAAAIAIAIVLERPPAAWFDAAYDQISIAHLTMSLLALAFWWAVSLRPLVPPRSRILLALVGAVVAVAALTLLHPGFARGPWSGVDPSVISVWLSHVHELQPLWPRQPWEWGRLVNHLGPALLVIPATAWWLRREWTDRRRNVWLLLLTSLLVYVPLAAAQRRFSAFAGGVIVILLVELLRRWLARPGNPESSFRGRLANVGVVLGLLLGFRIVGVVVILVTEGLAETPPSAQVAELPRGCDLTSMTRILADPSGLGATPKTVAAYMDFGPEIMYRTPHRVLATPYHRNYQGILGTYRLLTATQLDDARRLASNAEVDLILLCPPADRPYFGSNGQGTLYQRLVSGTTPEWIVPIQLPTPAVTGFRLFEVQ